MATYMSRVSFIQFQKDLGQRGIFSIQDVKKIFRSFDSRRLVEWQGKDYIKRIANGLYIFSDIDLDEATLWLISNRISRCSYISLESALSYYGLIPEGVFSVTAVRTAKTMVHEFSSVKFSYRSFKSSLFFGYKMLKAGIWNIRFAEPEKAILDYFYFNTNIQEESDFETLRINQILFNKIIDEKKFKQYLLVFSNKSLAKRMHKFIEFINA